MSPSACAHALFTRHSSTSIPFSPQHRRVNISFHNSLIYPPSLPLVGACTQATVLIVFCYVFVLQSHTLSCYITSRRREVNESFLSSFPSPGGSCKMTCMCILIPDKNYAGASGCFNAFKDQAMIFFSQCGGYYRRVYIVLCRLLCSLDAFCHR